MEKLILALDLDNYPEWIPLFNEKQSEVDDGHGNRAYTGIARVMMPLDEFQELFEVTQDILLVNVKTKRVYKNAIVFVDSDTYEVSWCVPKRKRRRREP